MKGLTLRDLVHDLAVTVLAGLAAAGGLFALLLIVGLLMNSFSFRPALVLVRGGLLVAGAMELFVSAGLLLWNRGGEKVRDSKQWTRFFKAFGLVPVLLLSAVVILFVGSIVDYYLYF